jgi:hypothetical protein
MATAAAQLQTSASPAAIATAQQDTPPAVTVDSEAPVKKINSQVVRQLGLDLKRRFETYAQDRQLQEQKFLRNLRQYLGIYDPEVESQLPRERLEGLPSPDPRKVHLACSRAS